MDNLKENFEYFMGIDQHKKFSSVAVVDKEDNLIEDRKLYHTDKREMLNYFKSFPSDKTKVVLEATGSWYWLADLLEEANLNTILAHPYKTRVIAESKIKTDSLESRLLAQLSRTDLIPQSFLVPKEVRSLRIVDINRFPTPKKLSSYIGIVPSIHQSGNFNHTGKITKQGNKYLRWALIEASCKAILKDGSLKAFYQRIEQKKGKQKARLAIANKLAHIIWAVLKYQQPYRPLKEKIYPRQARQLILSQI